MFHDVLSFTNPKKKFIYFSPKVHISNNNYQKESVLDGANKKRYVFSGLKPQELYKVFVQAKTEAGYGASKILKVATLKPARKYNTFTRIIFVGIYFYPYFYPPVFSFFPLPSLF